MESTNSYQVEDEVEETEKMLEQKKKEWELNHLQSLKEAEERKHAEEEDDMLFTYIRDETYDQVNKKSTKSSKTNRSVTNSTCTSSGSAKNHNVAGGSALKPRPDDCGVSPNKTNKNFQFSIKPFLLKLGDDKIAQIKKTAHETIQAKNDPPSRSPTVRSPRKKLSANKKIASSTSSIDKAVTTTNSNMAAKKTQKTSVTPARNSPRQRQINTKKQNSYDQPTTENKTTVTPNSSANSRNAVTLSDFISTSCKPASRHAVSDIKVINGVRSPKCPSSQKQVPKNNALSTVASSPNSVASPDSLSGDIRRSSRTPRPKVMNDEWVVFN